MRASASSAGWCRQPGWRRRAQKRSQAEQDGSEIRSGELERLLAQRQTLIERRDSFERLRDHATDGFERHTGSIWRPRVYRERRDAQPMAEMGQLQRFDSAREASGVPPIASEICALQDGLKGHKPPHALHKRSGKTAYE